MNRLTQLAFTGVLSLAAALASAQQPKADRPNRVVLGYLPAWRDAVADPGAFNYAAFTHICRAFLRPRADGTLYQEPGFFNPALENGARAHGVKLLMSIGGESHDPKRWLSLAGSPEHLHVFLDGLADLYREHQYDGVDIDWEPPPQTDADGQLYLSLLKAVRARFPDKLLTVALSPKEYAVQHLPLKEVIDTIDYFNAMTYDYAGPWTGIATFAANLHADAEGAHTRASVEDTLRHLIDAHHVPPAKVVMGLTFWGYRFRVDHLGDSFSTHATGLADFIEYPRVIDLLNTGLYTKHTDDKAAASYLVRNDGGCVVTFDDPTSTVAKCKLAGEMNLAGVMMWNAGADLGGGQMPLLSAIDETFGMAPLPVSRPLLEQEITRLSHKPVPASATLESLTAADAALRAARGLGEDKRWMQPPTTQAANP